MPRPLTDYEQTMRPVIVISGRDGTVAEYDVIATNTAVGIDYPHHKVHEGDTWESSYKSPDASPIADNANLDILIVVGAERAHFTFEGACGGDAELLLYEAATASANGTRLADANMNRNALNGPTTATYHSPTVTAAGNQLRNTFLPGGTRQQATGGTTRTGTEWILRTNTTYLLRLTNRAGSAQPASLAVQWYEK
jgi:hypothetical protein